MYFACVTTETNSELQQLLLQLHIFASMRALHQVDGVKNCVTHHPFSCYISKSMRQIFIKFYVWIYANIVGRILLLNRIGPKYNLQQFRNKLNYLVREGFSSPPA